MLINKTQKKIKNQYFTSSLTATERKIGHRLLMEMHFTLGPIF